MADSDHGDKDEGGQAQAQKQMEPEHSDLVGVFGLLMCIGCMAFIVVGVIRMLKGEDPFWQLCGATELALMVIALVAISYIRATEGQTKVIRNIREAMRDFSFLLMMLGFVSWSYSMKSGDDNLMLIAIVLDLVAIALSISANKL